MCNAFDTLTVYINDRGNKSNTQKEEYIMMNLHSKKAKKIISTVIIIFLVIAMILPILTYAFQ